MRKAFILHGIYGNPDENWFPWLKTELEKKNFKVFIPSFPTNEPKTTLDSWDEAWKPFDKKVQSDAILIGHSLGAAYSLRLLEKHKFDTCFLVAPAWGITGNTFDPVMGEIANQDFQWDAISSNCSNFEIFHADNDPYLPMERAQTLQRKLNCVLHSVNGAGHFNTASGFTEFPFLLQNICRNSGQ